MSRPWDGDDRAGRGTASRSGRAPADKLGLRVGQQSGEDLGGGARAQQTGLVSPPAALARTVEDDQVVGRLVGAGEGDAGAFGHVHLGEGQRPVFPQFQGVLGQDVAVPQRYLPGRTARSVKAELDTDAAAAQVQAPTVGAHGAQFHGHGRAGRAEQVSVVPEPGEPGLERHGGCLSMVVVGVRPASCPQAPPPR
ncbi:hypothetical protein [Pseudofrankia sp. BMG5.36]|uniref:hypothetical protein n=1 Tax=Pseudofrankia sp. BMG5.36 TaxID=1834512 RepID=UPI0008DB3329|nr:hypothetical protein [Pseudofrankia sp. BMG5.36]OHV42891.1 hypothetical protein BCD48_29250 [Pseudofrankia sp. BMG5.36]